MSRRVIFERYVNTLHESDTQFAIKLYILLGPDTVQNDFSILILANRYELFTIVGFI